MILYRRGNFSFSCLARLSFTFHASASTFLIDYGIGSTFAGISVALIVHRRNTHIIGMHVLDHLTILIGSSQYFVERKCVKK